MNTSEHIRALTEIRDPEFLFARQHLLEAGIDVAIEPERAVQFLEVSAAAGQPEAQFALSKLLLHGIGVKGNPLDALKWCERAVAANYIPALVMLSGFYCEGWGGIQRDDSRAIDLLTQASDAGFAHATALLATAYMEGIRVERDDVRGRKLQCVAAEQGDAGAQWQLAQMLLDDESKSSQLEAINWIRSAADRNFPSAHRQLAAMYEDGSHGFPRDLYLARWHRERADRIENGEV